MLQALKNQNWKPLLSEVDADARSLLGRNLAPAALGRIYVHAAEDNAVKGDLRAAQDFLGRFFAIYRDQEFPPDLRFRALFTQAEVTCRQVGDAGDPQAAARAAEDIVEGLEVALTLPEPARSTAVRDGSICMMNLVKPYLANFGNLFIEPIAAVMRALDDSESSDHEWRLYILVTYIKLLPADAKGTVQHATSSETGDVAQSDHGDADVLKLSERAVRLAKTYLPAHYVDMLRFQVGIAMQSPKFVARLESSPEVKADGLHRAFISLELLRAGHNESKAQAILADVEEAVLGSDDRPKTFKSAKQTATPGAKINKQDVLLSFCQVCYRHCPDKLPKTLEALRQMMAAPGADVLLKRKYTVIKALELSARNCRLPLDAYLSANLRALDSIQDDLNFLQSATQNAQFAQEACTAVWQIASASLRASPDMDVRKSILPYLLMISNLLSQVNSPLLDLRSRADIEIGKCYEVEQLFVKALASLGKAIALAPADSQQSFKRIVRPIVHRIHVKMRTNKDVQTLPMEDQALILLEQARTATSKSQTFFQQAFRRTATILTEAAKADRMVFENPDRRHIFRDVTFELMLAAQNANIWDVTRAAATILIDYPELLADLQEPERKALISQANLSLGSALVHVSDSRPDGNAEYEFFLKTFDIALAQKEHWMLEESVKKLLALKPREGHLHAPAYQNAVRHVYEALYGTSFKESEMFSHVAVMHVKCLAEALERAEAPAAEEKDAKSSSAARKSREVFKRSGAKAADGAFAADTKQMEEALKAGFACKAAPVGVKAALVYHHAQLQISKGASVGVIELDIILKIFTTIEHMDWCKRNGKESSAAMVDQLIIDIKQAPIPEDLAVALWVRVARILLGSHSAKAVLDVLKNIRPKLYKDMSNQYVALAENYNGQAMMSTVGENDDVASREVRIQACYHFAVSIRSSDVGSGHYWNAMRNFWNAACVLGAAPESRALIKGALESILQSLPDLRTLTNSSVPDQELVQKLYLELLQIYQDQNRFRDGLHLIEKACQSLPSSLHRPLWKVKVLFGWMIGRPVAKDMFEPAAQAYIWVTLGTTKHRSPEKQKQDLRTAIEVLTPAEAELKAELLQDYAIWLLEHREAHAEIQESLDAADSLADAMDESMRMHCIKLRLAYMLWLCAPNVNVRAQHVMRANKAVDSCLQFIFDRYQQSIAPAPQEQQQQQQQSPPSHQQQQQQQQQQPAKPAAAAAAERPSRKGTRPEVPAAVSIPACETNLDDRPIHDSDWIFYKPSKGLASFTQSLVAAVPANVLEEFALCLTLISQVMAAHGFHILGPKCLALAQLISPVRGVAAKYLGYIQKCCLHDLGIPFNVKSGRGKNKTAFPPHGQRLETSPVAEAFQLIIAQQMLERRLPVLVSDIFPTDMAPEDVWSSELPSDALRVLADVATMCEDADKALKLLLKALSTANGHVSAWTRLAIAVANHLFTSKHRKSMLHVLTVITENLDSIASRHKSLMRPSFTMHVAMLYRWKGELLFRGATTRDGTHSALELMEKAESVFEANKMWFLLIDTLLLHVRMVLHRPRKSAEDNYDDKIMALEKIDVAENIYTKLPKRQTNDKTFSLPSERVHLHFLLHRARINLELADAMYAARREIPRSRTIEEKITGFVRGTSEPTPNEIRWIQLQAGSLKRAHEFAKEVLESNTAVPADIAAVAMLIMAKCQKLTSENDEHDQVPVVSSDELRITYLKAISTALQEGCCGPDLFAVAADMIAESEKSDPVVAFAHLALFQSLLVENTALELLLNAHDGSSVQPESFWLREYARVRQNRVQGSIQADQSVQYQMSTMYLERYSLPWRKVHVNVNYDQIVKSLPKRFKILVLQHSIDRRQLYAGLIWRKKDAVPAVPAKPKKAEAAGTGNGEQDAPAEASVLILECTHREDLENLAKQWDAALATSDHELKQRILSKIADYLRPALSLIKQGKSTAVPEVNSKKLVKPKEKQATLSRRNSVTLSQASADAPPANDEFHLVLCLDDLLQRLPVEELFTAASIERNELGINGPSILSVSRDFGVHLFLSRTKLGSGAKAGDLLARRKDFGAADWENGGDVNVDVQAFNYLITASNVAAFKEESKRFHKAEGVSEEGTKKLRTVEAVECVKGGSTIYVGEGPLLEFVNPSYLCRSDLSACRLLISLSENARPPASLALILSLQGVQSIVISTGRSAALRPLSQPAESLGELIRNNQNASEPECSFVLYGLPTVAYRVAR